MHLKYRGYCFNLPLKILKGTNSDKILLIPHANIWHTRTFGPHLNRHLGSQQKFNVSKAGSIYHKEKNDISFSTDSPMESRLEGLILLFQLVECIKN